MENKFSQIQERIYLKYPLSLSLDMMIYMIDSLMIFSNKKTVVLKRQWNIEAAKHQTRWEKTRSGMSYYNAW